MARSQHSTRVLLGASIFLNICLIVAVAVAYSRLPADVPSLGFTPVAHQDAPEAIAPQAQAQGTSWDTVASQDYAEYAESLRARGIPEYLVERIIIAGARRNDRRTRRTFATPSTVHAFW